MNSIVLSKLKVPRLASSLVKLCSTSTIKVESTQKGNNRTKNNGS